MMTKVLPTMACAAGRRGLKTSFAPVERPKIATLTRVRQHGQHHAGLGASIIYLSAWLSRHQITN
jgi:hypothetical protein